MKRPEMVRNFVAGAVPRPAKGTKFDVPCRWPDQCGCLACVRISKDGRAVERTRRERDLERW
jgi:hypothetical protein